jgi:SAM-dependent methyltransferase
MNSSWQNFHDQKIKEIAQNSKVILDVGGGKRFQKGMQEYEELFKNHDYKTLDCVADYSPDILGDIKDIPLKDESADAIICRAVLEHVDDPFKAVSEMYRILRPSGACLTSLPFLYPYHAEKGYYGDFYRYTNDGVKYLFRNFSKIEICNIRGIAETLVILLPNKFLRKILTPLARFLDKLKPSKNQTSGFIIYCVK